MSRLLFLLVLIICPARSEEKENLVTKAAFEFVAWEKENYSIVSRDASTRLKLVMKDMEAR